LIKSHKDRYIIQTLLSNFLKVNAENIREQDLGEKLSGIIRVMEDEVNKEVEPLIQETLCLAEHCLGLRSYE
jgi:hypothetical protein